FQATGDSQRERAAHSRQRLETNIKGFDEALATLEPLIKRPAGRELLAKAKDSQAAYKASVTRALAAADAGKADEAVKLAYGETYEALQAFAADLRKLLDDNQHAMEEASLAT